MKYHITVSALLLLAESAIAQSNMVSDYQILNSTSIFSRNRGVDLPSSAPSTSANTRNPAPVLIGIIKSDSEFTAVLEIGSQPGGRSPQSIVVRRGDTLAWDGSRVAEVTMDALHLTGGARSATVISIGNNLQNQPGNLTPMLPIIPSADAATNPNARNTGSGPVTLNSPRLQRPAPRNRVSPGPTGNAPTARTRQPSLPGGNTPLE